MCASLCETRENSGTGGAQRYRPIAGESMESGGQVRPVCMSLCLHVHKGTRRSVPAAGLWPWPWRWHAQVSGTAETQI